MLAKLKASVAGIARDPFSIVVCPSWQLAGLSDHLKEMDEEKHTLLKFQANTRATCRKLLELHTFKQSSMFSEQIQTHLEGGSS